MTTEGMDTIPKTFQDKSKNPSYWQEFRKLVVEMVLATDMSNHGKLLGDLKTLTEKEQVRNEIIQLDTIEKRLIVLKNLLHCADLGNPTKKTEVYTVWANNIIQESWAQGDLEKKADLKISPMCDRDCCDIPRIQIYFIDFIIHPLYEAWAVIVPDSLSEQILDQIMTNREYYIKLRDKNDEEKLKSEQREKVDSAVSGLESSEVDENKK